jgi:hypothetical protein
MKGPHERIKYDLRRVWECPQCRHRERTPGDVTTMTCQCRPGTRGEPIHMKLVEDGPRLAHLPSRT